MPEFFDVATYDYTKVQAVNDIPETYTEVARLVTPVREEGVYIIGFSLTWDYDQANKSVFMRFSIDAGGSWTELISKPSDTDDVRAFTYAFPKERSQGIFDMRFEARKQDTSGLFNIGFLDVWYDRKGDIA